MRNVSYHVNLLIIASLLCVIGCQSAEQASAPSAGIEKAGFGTTKDGQNVDLYTLTNANGLVTKITNYGGTVTELWVPDRDGKLDDIVLGFDNVSDYEEKSPYFGSLIGRFGNRIGNATFTLDGTEYQLPANDGQNTLHAGVKGFDKVVWDATPTMTDNGPALKLHYLSKDMEEGFPGNLDVTVTYTLTNKNELVIDYEATTDKPTVCNLTNHNYYNLAGQGSGDILGHRLMIKADAYTPVDKGLIPTGRIAPVKGTPMDFTKPAAIGARINKNTKQLTYGSGYDHNWVLNKTGSKLSLAARVYEPTTGRIMKIYTNEPGIQFYAGNFLDGTITGKEGKVYQHRYAFCLETQHFPDSPNKPEFPSTTLRPGEVYKTKTVHKFSAK